MGKIVGYIATSLDGYIAGPDGGIDWLEPFQAVDYGYTEFLKGIEIVVMGRLTYEKCLSFGIGWPYPDQDALIVTSRDIECLPARTQTWIGSVSDLVTHLKSAEGDAWIVGGSRLQQAVLDADGMDSLDIFIIPILLGNGIPFVLEIRPLSLAAFAPFETAPDGYDAPPVRRRAASMMVLRSVASNTATTHGKCRQPPTMERPKLNAWHP